MNVNSNLPESVSPANKEWYSLYCRARKILYPDTESESMSSLLQSATFFDRWIYPDIKPDININSSIVYLMGDAGTGKSTIINTIREYIFSHTVNAAASTNIAATNIMWTSCHKMFYTWINVGIDWFRTDDETNHPKTAIRADGGQYRATTRKKYEPLPLLIIDEISMIDAENMDMYLMLQHRRHIFVNRTMGGDYLKAWKDINDVRENNPHRSEYTAQQFYNAIPEHIRPKILLVGDFWQLPPVVRGDRKEYLLCKYNSIFAFDSYSWHILNPTPINLKKNYRQLNEAKEPDESRFVQILKNIKYNCRTPEDIDFLNEKVLTREIYDSFSIKPLVVSTTNASVDRINKKVLSTIQQETRSIEIKYYPRPRSKLSQTEQLLFMSSQNISPTYAPDRWKAFVQENIWDDKQFDIKLWCQIMTLRWDREWHYFNGTIWYIEWFGESEVVWDDWQERIVPHIDFIHRSPEEKEFITSRIHEQHIMESMPVLDRATGRLCSLDIWSFHWFPITLAYAITIHKSQGKSLDNIIIDPNDWMYEKNQAYVALSRTKSYKWLWFKSKINPSDIKYDQYILDRMSTQKVNIYIHY